MSSGGRILARFDCPAYKFLFPDDKGATHKDDDGGDDGQRTLVLNHSRQYKVRISWKAFGDHLGG